MSWSRTTQPNRTNIAKRLHAALEALNAADHLLAQGDHAKVRKSADAARDWVRHAIRQLDNAKGRRLASKAP